MLIEIITDTFVEATDVYKAQILKDPRNNQLALHLHFHGEDSKKITINGKDRTTLLLVIQRINEAKSC